MESTACMASPVRNNCAAALLFRAGLFALSLALQCRIALPARNEWGTTMQHFFLYLLALGAGVSVATQQVLNGSLRTALGSPAWAGLISYAGGLITMIVAVIALGERVPSWKTSRRCAVVRVVRRRVRRRLHPAGDPAAALARRGDAVRAGHRRPGARRGDAGSFRRVRVDAASRSAPRGSRARCC